jgi:hypothetical protein
MKALTANKIKLALKLLFMQLVIVVLVVILLNGCKKSDDPEPNNNNNNNNTTYNGTLCGDTICNFPWRLMPVFLPSGYYDTGDQTTTLTLDSVGETPAYENEAIRIVYTYDGGWGWGASFLNNNDWNAMFDIKSTVTKLTFKLRIDYSANVTFNAFADQNYGKIEFYKLASPVATPVWQDVTIPITAVPGDFAAPLNVIIDGITTPGQVVVVDIKDLQFE